MLRLYDARCFFMLDDDVVLTFAHFVGVCNGSVGSIETRHVSDTWKSGSLSFLFTHPPEDLKK